MKFRSVLFVLLVPPDRLLRAISRPQEGSWSHPTSASTPAKCCPSCACTTAPSAHQPAQPVLVLHGTTESGAAMLAPTFGGELFGEGQPLDAKRYYIILPDAIGIGKSSKPRTACAPSSRSTTTTTWSTRNTGWSPSISG
jgi:homoserine O-acetyltransferase